MTWTAKQVLQGASLVCLLSLRFAASQGTDNNPDVPDDLEIDDDEMGPAALLWPPDRSWAADMDNTAPCGSRAAPGVRTQFPLTGGQAQLFARDDFYNVKLGISLSENPTSNADFTTIMENRGLEDLNPGFTCVPLPNAPAGTAAGRHATLQMMYTSDFGTPQNQTFYTCADITYVEAANFKTKVPCFNQTQIGIDDGDDGEDDDGDGQVDEADENIPFEYGNDGKDNDDDGQIDEADEDDGYDDKDNDGDGQIDEADEDDGLDDIDNDGDGQIDEDDEDRDGDDDDQVPGPSGGRGSLATGLPKQDHDNDDDDDDDGPERKESSESSRSGGLPRAAVAGIAAGTVSAVILLSALGLLCYRHNQQKKRRERLARMEANARAAGHLRGGSTAKEGVFA